MKSQAREIIRHSSTSQQARLILREYLQHLILRQMFEQKILHNLVFHGGTALRIIYGINRFSEDLDFHLLNPQKNPILAEPIRKICKKLILQGYQISEPKISARTVQSISIDFEELLFEFGLSNHHDAKLRIKIEIDTNPPEGFQYERKLVNRFMPYAVNVHNLPSFLAGKLHAIMQRPYTKGRDYYDLIFLLARWPDTLPNLIYLQNALSQTHYQGEPITHDNWRNVIVKIKNKTDWKAVVHDVEPFLESDTDRQLLTIENLLKVLKL